MRDNPITVWHLVGLMGIVGLVNVGLDVWSSFRQSQPPQTPSIPSPAPISAPVPPYLLAEASPEPTKAQGPRSLAEWMSIIKNNCDILLVEVALGKPDGKEQLE